MPVLDASVVAEYLAAGPRREGARAALFDDDRTRWVPHLVDAEVGHVLRRLAGQGGLDPAHAKAALSDLQDLPLVRAGHVALLDRAWEFRDHVSFYDAIYVALAERIGCELITLDRRLARGARDLVEIVVLGEG